jgi:indolepyruvate ferredoxin oxidoreductase
MAYKAGYETGHRHTNTAMLQKIGGTFEGDYTVNYHLAPPMISKTNEKGELQKQKFGPLMLTGFKLLKHFKVLRGTPLDIFGNTEEREMERALIGEYVASIDDVLAKLNADNHALALEIANLPDAIKGFGHVKARNVAAVRGKWNGLMEKWRNH